MARILGITLGLMPQESVAYTEAKMAPKAKSIKIPEEIRCECCQGLIGFNNTRKTHTSPCKACRNMFGDAWLTGQTNESPEAALKKMANLREQGWGMLLRYGHFGSSAGSISVEPGDIFPIKRAGSADRFERDEPASAERTRELFTVEIDVGPHVLVQFPHEISAISLVAIMRMKAAGEVSEAFVSADDKSGHFAPTAEMREQIYACFGRMTGEPQT